jgi:hypothetical protein
MNLVQANTEAVRPFKIGPIRLPEPPVKSNETKQCNNAEERRPHTRAGCFISRLRVSLRHYGWKFQQSRAGTDVCYLIPVPPPTPLLFGPFYWRGLKRNCDAIMIKRVFWDCSECEPYRKNVTVACNVTCLLQFAGLMGVTTQWEGILYTVRDFGLPSWCEIFAFLVRCET